MSFDTLISTIKASLQPFTHKSQAPDPEAIAPTLSPLKQTFNAPNDVFVNICSRRLHSPRSVASRYPSYEGCCHHHLSFETGLPEMAQLAVVLSISNVL